MADKKTIAITRSTKTTLKNYQIEIEYDGTDFFGWQVQPQKRTIQGEIQSALTIIYQAEISLAGSGRTSLAFFK